MAKNSPIEAVHAAIQSQNIFSKAGIVREQNVWGRGFPDVPSLNDHASDAVLKALEQVRTTDDKVTSLVITAQQGQGKTHLLNRIRRQLLQESDFTFIYANVLSYTDLNQVHVYFLRTIVDSLSRANHEGVTQWQMIASAMMNSVVKNQQSTKSFIRKFDQVHQTYLNKSQNLLDALTTKIKERKPGIDPYIIRAVIGTLSLKASSYAEKWLVGDQLEESHAKYLGLPPHSQHLNHSQEKTALSFIKQVLSLIGEYSSVLICFDELESDQYNEGGFMSHQVIAFLIKSLYDTLEQSKTGKGVVILSVMLPDTFRSIMSLPGGTPERIETFNQKKAIELTFINGTSMVELAKLYLNLFYRKKEVVPPNELYPFDEAELTQYAQTNKPTVREALRWCAENFKVAEDPLPADAKSRFEFALNRETEDDYSDDLEDNQFIGEVLRFGFSTLIGEALQGTTSTGELLKQMIVQGIEDITPKSKNNNWINFKIIVTDEGKEIKIGLMVLQNTHGLSVGAGMSRIIDYETFGFNRGCLVRSHEKKIKENWDSHAYLEFLVQKLGGEWVDLKLEDVKPLIQLYNVYQQRDYYKLEEQDILTLAKEITVENPLLREILSNPASNIDSLIQDFMDEVGVEDEQNSEDAELMNSEIVFDLPNSSDSSEIVSPTPTTPDNPQISSAVAVTPDPPTEETQTQETQTKVNAATSSKTAKRGKAKTSTAGKGKMEESSKTVESEQSESSKPSAKATSGKTKSAEKSPPPAVEQSESSKPSAKATSGKTQSVEKSTTTPAKTAKKSAKSSSQTPQTPAKTKASSQKGKSVKVEQKAPSPAAEKSPPVTPPPTPEPEKQWFEKSYSGQTIVAFHFNGERYETESWKDFLINVCILIKLNHAKDFYKVQEAVRGRKNYYFSPKPEDLNKAEKISGTNLYVETMWSANQVVTVIKKIVDLFEYPADVVAIETHE